jgi:hypothetical protein
MQMAKVPAPEIHLIECSLKNVDITHKINTELNIIINYNEY